MKIEYKIQKPCTIQNIKFRTNALSVLALLPVSVEALKDTKVQYKLPSHIPRDLTASVLRPRTQHSRHERSRDAARSQRGTQGRTRSQTVREYFEHAQNSPGQVCGSRHSRSSIVVRTQQSPQSRCKDAENVAQSHLGRR